MSKLQPPGFLTLTDPQVPPFIPLAANDPRKAGPDLFRTIMGQALDPQQLLVHQSRWVQGIIEATRSVLGEESLRVPAIEALQVMKVPLLRVVADGRPTVKGTDAPTLVQALMADLDKVNDPFEDHDPVGIVTVHALAASCLNWPIHPADF